MEISTRLVAHAPGLAFWEALEAEAILGGVDRLATRVLVPVLESVLDPALAAPVGVDAGGDVDVEALLETGGAAKDDREGEEPAPLHTTMTSASFFFSTPSISSM